MKRYFLMLALPPTTRSSATKILGKVAEDLIRRKLKMESKTCHFENIPSYLQSAQQGKAYYICCYLKGNGVKQEDLQKAGEYLREHRGILIHSLHRVNHKEYLFDELKKFLYGATEKKSEQ